MALVPVIEGVGSILGAEEDHSDIMARRVQHLQSTKESEFGAFINYRAVLHLTYLLFKQHLNRVKSQSESGLLFPIDVRLDITLIASE